MLTSIPQTINIKHWLFKDLQQSIALVDEYDLFEDLDFCNLKADKPNANLFYGSYFNTLTKLCLIPALVILSDLLLVFIWGLVIGLFSGKTPLFFISLMFEEIGDFIALFLFVSFIGLVYFGIMYVVLSNVVWKFNALKHIICPKLKHGDKIINVIQHLTSLGIKIFLFLSTISSIVGVILFHRPITMYLSIPIIIISYTITSWIFNSELQRIGIQPLFAKLSNLIKNTTV